jgi:anti-repressor protein
MNELATGKTMTLKEVAEITGAAYSTIAAYAQKAGWTENGKQTLLNEKQVTILLEALKQGNNNQYDLPSSLEGIETSQSRAFRIELLHKQIEAELEAEIAELKTKAIEAEQRLAIAEPKADFTDLAMRSKDVLSINDAAKVLKLGYGNVTLFKKLRSMGILMADNVPYQEYISRGYFRVDESPILIGDYVQIKRVTRVTQKGMAWLSKIFEKETA